MHAQPLMIACDLYLLLLAGALAISACTEPPSEASAEVSTSEEVSSEVGSSESEEVGNSVDTQTAGDGDGDDDGDGDTAEPPDCDNLNPLPLEFDIIYGAKSAEDFVFDAEGYLLSIDDNALFRAPYGQTAQFLFPGVSSA